MLWAYATEAKPQVLPCMTPARVACLAALGGGSGMLLAAGCATGAVLLADAATGCTLASLAAHEGMVQSLQSLALAWAPVGEVRREVQRLLQGHGRQQGGGGQELQATAQHGDGPTAEEGEEGEGACGSGPGAPGAPSGARPAAAGPPPPGQPRAEDAWLLSAGEDGRVCLWDLQQLLATGAAGEAGHRAAPAPARPPPAAYVRLPRAGPPGSGAGEGSRARQWVAAAAVHRSGDAMLVAVGGAGGHLLLYEMFPGGWRCGPRLPLRACASRLAPVTWRRTHGPPARALGCMAARRGLDAHSCGQPASIGPG
jgi:hypothetical protein